MVNSYKPSSVTILAVDDQEEERHPEPRPDVGDAEEIGDSPDHYWSFGGFWVFGAFAAPSPFGEPSAFGAPSAFAPPEGFLTLTLGPASSTSLAVTKAWS